MKISVGWAQTEESFREREKLSWVSLDEIGNVRREERGEGILDAEGRQGQEAARSQLSEYQEMGWRSGCGQGMDDGHPAAQSDSCQLPHKPGGCPVIEAPGHRLGGQEHNPSQTSDSHRRDSYLPL